MKTRKDFFNSVNREVEKAKLNFPETDLLGYAFVEKSGEFVCEMLNGKQNLGDYSHLIYKKAVQTVAMVVRLLEEGCPELELEPMLGKYWEKQNDGL